VPDLVCPTLGTWCEFPLPVDYRLFTRLRKSEIMYALAT
jgi:hypothetical protein